MTLPRILRWPLKSLLNDTSSAEAEDRIRERVLSRLHGSTDRDSRRKRASGRLLLLAAMATALAAAAPLLVKLAQPGIEHPLQLEGGRTFKEVSANAAGGERRVTFTDGSNIAVEPGGKVLGLASTGTKVLALLAQGRATFEIVPGGPRQWTVEAGLLRVEVLGTRFSVTRTPNEVLVAVTRGSVLVRSSELEDGIARVDAGEQLAVRKAVAVPTKSPSETPPSDASTNPEAAVPSDTPLSLDQLDAEPLNSTSHPSRHRVRAPSASHPSVSGPPASASDWMRKADEARMLGDLTRAVDSLEQLLKHHPTSPNAITARFQLSLLYLSLGRLEEAAASLTIVARDPGPLSEDAYRRLLEIRQQRGDLRGSRQLAEEYLERYPQGRYRALFARSLNQP